MHKYLILKGTLLWNPVMQSQLFGAVFYGSLVTIFLAGYMADRLGPKILLAGALTDYVLMTLVSPYLTHTDYRLFFASRVLMGIGEVCEQTIYLYKFDGVKLDY